MRITLEDVAREAGVNLSTASRSLNDAYGVHPKTREHVVSVAERLKYHPNRVARGLATGRSNSLGLMISDIRNPFFAEVARGAEDAAYAANCDLILCNSDLNPEKQMRYFESLLSKRVDGILINSVGDLTRAQQQQVSASGVPIVLFNRTSRSRTLSSVTPDNRTGGQIAADHLIGLGHRRIAHLTGPKNHHNLRERANGFLKRLQEKGIPQPVVLHGEHTFPGGYNMAKKLLAQNAGATALFAANDVIAFGCIRAAMELGIRVPEDLSIIGFDNLELGQIISPPLTTIHQPKYDLGKAAAELLLSLVINPEQAPEQRILSLKLVERRSCRAV